MNPRTTAQDILNDIEFEIAQGMLSKEAFGPALEAVRQFQNRLRSQTFKSIRMNDPYREIISRQFQTTDMLLALLQEMALRIQALQTALEKLPHPNSVLDRSGVLDRPSPPETQSAESATVSDDFPPASKTVLPSKHISSVFPKTVNSTVHEIRSPDEILNAMRPETISVPLQTRTIRWPLIGGLLTRLRIFYQRPAMHYTALLSERQAPVNRALGDRILHLQALLQEQQQQIQALKTIIEQTNPETAADGDQHR